MIEAKTENGHCELSMSGTGVELTEDMRVIIHAAYNAIMISLNREKAKQPVSAGCRVYVAICPR